MSYDINITVNGNRCKQFSFQNKTFIEAKQGSEYVIEIKNNYYKRILAVAAVDGLNVLTGKTASEADSGYIIDSYHAEKIKGFRFSDDEWAMFKFGYKFNGKTYAQSKNDGSEMNCGVIGVRLFYEQEPIVIYNTPIVTWNIPSPTPIPQSPWPMWGTTICGGISNPSNGGTSYTANVNFMASAANSSNSSDGLCGSTMQNSCLRSSGAKSRSSNKMKAMNLSSPEPKSFDMGTEWGRKEQSKVHTVNFEKGCLAHSLDIYYASRESLIEMGVPFNNNIKVNLPQSFPEKYAKPPKNWVG
jgi:hypothetical protein